MDFNAELGVMLDDCRDAFGVSVTVAAAPAAGISATTGLPNASASSSSVTAIRSSTPGSTMGMGGGNVQVGESEYRVKAADLSFTPTAGATVTDGSQTLRVYQVDQDVNDLAWVLKCRTNRQT